MKKKNSFSIAFAVLFIISSCRPSFEYFPLDNAVIDGSFPDREIVFQTDASDYGWADKLGFINSDGGDLTYFHLEESMNMKFPMWTDDGKAVLYGFPSNIVAAYIEKDYPMRLKNVYVQQVSIIRGTQEILLTSAVDENTLAIKQEDFTTGVITATYPMKKNVRWISLGTNNLFNNYLLYERIVIDEYEREKSELVIYNTKIHKEAVILSHNRFLSPISNPSFSPDGEWIAYTSNDGIYLIRTDGSENHLLIKLNYPLERGWPSTVSWSPDGTSIVYHHCNSSDRYDQCGILEENLHNYIVYRYDLETGEETVLVEGGLNPYWRWKEIE